MVTDGVLGTGYWLPDAAVAVLASNYVGEMITIERALPSDLPHVRDLISSAGLPLDGFGVVPTEVFVARDRDWVVGTASLETHGGHGLLRSVAVDEDRRDDGIGVVGVVRRDRDPDGAETRCPMPDARCPMPDAR